MVTSRAVGAPRPPQGASEKHEDVKQWPTKLAGSIAVYDEYPWEYTSFQIGNETVLVKDDRLAEALSAIPEKERNIILMYWCLDMADRDIADHMGIARRTVNTHRQRAYRLLKKLMGGEADE